MVVGGRYWVLGDRTFLDRRISSGCLTSAEQILFWMVAYETHENSKTIRKRMGPEINEILQHYSDGGLEML